MTDHIHTTISKEMVIEGEVTAQAGRLEVYGLINGRINVGDLIIHEGGKVVGDVRAQTITTSGFLQGKMQIEGLLDIGATGSVNGDVIYGQMALKEGGELSADVRNIPPTLAGDMKLVVSKGKGVRLTTQDLTAIDPDDDAKDLTFAVSALKNGYIAHVDKPKTVAHSFTKSELKKGAIVFVHDGKEARVASFAVVVTDGSGANSGSPRTVQVEVRG